MLMRDVGVGVREYQGFLKPCCQVRAVKSGKAVQKGVSSHPGEACAVRLDYFNWTPGGN